MDSRPGGVDNGKGRVTKKSILFSKIHRCKIIDNRTLECYNMGAQGKFLEKLERKGEE